MSHVEAAPRFTCPYCGAHDFPITKSKVATGGWIIFGLLLISLVFFWLCWLGLFIRDTHRVCSRCGMNLG